MHLLCFVTHSDNLAGGSVQSDDRGLIQYDSASLNVDQGIGGTEVNGNVGRKIEETHDRLKTGIWAKKARLPDVRMEAIPEVPGPADNTYDGFRFQRCIE